MPLGDITFGATNLKSGADADKPTTPKAGDFYVATDTVKFYICVGNGSWEDITDMLTYLQVFNFLKNIDGMVYNDGTDVYARVGGANINIESLIHYPQVFNFLKNIDGMVYNDGTDVYARISGANINIDSLIQNVRPGLKILKQDSNLEGGEYILEGPNAAYPNVTVDHYAGNVRMWQPGTVSGIRIFNLPTLGANAFEGYLCPVLPDNEAPTIISQQYWSDTTPGSLNTAAITGPAYILGGIAMKQTLGTYSFCSRVINGVAHELNFIKGAAGQDSGADGKIGYATIYPFYLRPGEVTYWHVESTFSGSSTIEYGASVQVAYIQL